MEELLARLRAALRRDRQPRPTKFRLGRYEIDITAHTIIQPDDGLPRPGGGSPHADRVAAAGVLLPAPGQLVSSDRLLSQIWGPGFERSTTTSVPHGRAAPKLEEDPHRPAHLLTEPGMGYRYRPSSRSPEPVGRPPASSRAAVVTGQVLGPF